MACPYHCWVPYWRSADACRERHSHLDLYLDMFHFGNVKPSCHAAHGSCYMSI